MIAELFFVLCAAVLGLLGWIAGKAVGRWDRAVDDWAMKANGLEPPASDCRPRLSMAGRAILHLIADDAWWTPENEIEAATLRKLSQQGLIAETAKGLILTPEGQNALSSVRTN